MFAGPLGRSTFTPPKSSFDSPLYGLVSLRRFQSRRESADGGGRSGPFQEPIRKEVSQSGRVPGKRPPSAAGFLRLSGRALGALADDEPDRVHLCDGPFAAATNEGLWQPRSVVNDALHAGPPSRAPLATPERFGSDCSSLRGKGFQGWIDGSGERRLTSPIHNI